LSTVEHYSRGKYTANLSNETNLSFRLGRNECLQ